MSEINNAWRASIGFAAAIRDCRNRRDAWWNVTVAGWNSQHPNHHAYGVTADATSFDPRITGFADGDRKADPPEGLTRAQRRPGELRPARGTVGDRWRKAIRELNTCPSMDKVFADYGVPVYGLIGMKLRRFNVQDLGNHGVWLTASADVAGSVDRPVEHLTPMKLSEYYTALEAHLVENPPSGEVV
jgi:hypothetical protein